MVAWVDELPRDDIQQRGQYCKDEPGETLRDPNGSTSGSLLDSPICLAAGREGSQRHDTTVPRGPEHLWPHCKSRPSLTLQHVRAGGAISRTILLTGTGGVDGASHGGRVCQVLEAHERLVESWHHHLFSSTRYTVLLMIMVPLRARAGSLVTFTSRVPAYRRSTVPYRTVQPWP